MASTSADTARSAHKQGRRPAPRVIPAIPLRLSRPSRAARPLTPEESNTGALIHRESDPEPQPASEKEPKDHPRTTVQAPLTPESKSSGPIDGDGEISAQISPQAAVGKETPDTQGSEVIEQPNADHNLPSPSHPEPKTAAVNGSRNVTTIPTHLPPPFYPADHNASQTSTTNSAGVHIRPLADQTASHRPRPSVEGIVFGAAQESPAMPSTPQETDLDIRGQHQGPLRPPPGFAPPQFAPPFHPGHSHHPSDATGPWSQPGYSMAPPPAAGFGNGHDYNQPSYSTGPVVYPNPYQNHLSPGDAPPTANGSTTSHSQSPSNPQFTDGKPGSDHGEETQGLHYQNGNVPPALRLEESHIALANWLSSQFGKPNLADSVLQVRSPEAILLSLPAHGIVVSRSPVVAEAMRRGAPAGYQSSHSPRLIDILTSDKFLTSESLNEAMKFLYGAPLLSPPLFLFGLGPYDQEGEQSPTFHEARTRMAHALSYAAAGRALQLPILQACGAEIASALLRWDNVEQALHYGLDEFKLASSLDANGLDAHNTGAGAILNCTIDFLACQYPMDFVLYPIASELRDDPRLPTVSETRAPSHNPRLSKIRFGDALPEEEMKPDYTTCILSSILLSLPLVLLDRLFSHQAIANRLGWTNVVKVMRDVIEEREKRRQKVLKTLQMSNDNGPRPLVENLYYEEHVERVEASPIHPSGHRPSATRLSGQP